MTIIEDILYSENAYDILFNKLREDEPKTRYLYESILLGRLSQHALNKSKNVNKPKFEGLELIEIYAHFREEVRELKIELTKDKIDYELTLEELADCAGLLTGLLAYIIKHKNYKNDLD